MDWWDREAKIRLLHLSINLDRYVDGVDLALEIPEKGARYVSGRKQISVAEDEIVKDDMRTMLLFQQIGNSIHPSIQLEVDFPSKHEDNNMPILNWYE